MAHVLHLTELSRWRAGGDVEADSLGTEGFLHASPDEATMLAVANAFYSAPEEALVVLVVNTEKADAEVRWEAAAPVPPPGVRPDVLFPHVYGPIPRPAVTGLRRLVRNPEGRYTALETVMEPGPCFQG
ncbi:MULTISPECIES: DUF952 domain-containing protein [Nocardiopsis]|uniref:DUF952 domain-containing protein n=1 Tax=Nocardiopsis TaxID=2013 RepID=UPI0003478C98|nr:MULTISPECIES: DUF952 domain-containing protein [Nocardiopsis]PWV47909.1 uncharacterized protein (DUF952 family) [Nocardiopsis sp. L17-MgMaSL7]